MTILLIAAGRPQEIAPTIQRISPPIPCIVGAGLAPALEWCGATAREPLPFAPLGLAPALGLPWWGATLAHEPLPFAPLGLAPALWPTGLAHPTLSREVRRGAEQRRWTRTVDVRLLLALYPC